MPPIQYRFTPEAQQIYEDYHWLMEQRKLAEPRQGMRAAMAKMQGYTARIAGILHVLWEVAADQIPDETIPAERVTAAKTLAEFYLGQVLLIHNDEGACQGELNPILSKILLKAQQLGGITARVAKQSIKSLKNTTPPKVREYLSELVAMGYGAIEGQGNRSKFIPKTVDPTVDLAKNAETLITSSCSPIRDSNCRPTVDQTVDPIKKAEVYENNRLQPGVDPNCRPVDHFFDKLELSISSDLTSTDLEENKTGKNGLQSLQVYSSAESLDITQVGTVDPGSTLRSTVDCGSTVTAKKLDSTEFEAVDLESTLGSTVNCGSTVTAKKFDDNSFGTVDLESTLGSTVDCGSTVDSGSTVKAAPKLPASIESDRALVQLIQGGDKPRLTVDESKLDLHRPGFELKPWKPTLQVKPYEELRRMVIDIETLGLDPSSD